MNTQNPHEADVLARALHGQVDGMTEAPLTFDAIAGRAGDIRRRRRIAVSVGVAAAAAAVLVPTALLADGGATRSNPPQVTTQSPSVEPTDATSPPAPEPSLAGPQVLTPAELPQAAPPRLGYAAVTFDGKGRAVGGTITRPDGVEVALPPLEVRDLVRQDDTWFASMWDAATERSLLYGIDAATGETPDPGETVGGLAVSGDGSIMAWVEPGGTVRARQTGAQTLITIGQVAQALRPVGIVGDDCARDRGCGVVVELSGAAMRSVVVWSGGEVDRIAGDFQAKAADATRVAGVVSVDELTPSTCSELRDEGTGTVLWQTCDHQLGAFAPGGQLMVGLPTYYDGIGPGSIAMLRTQDGSALASWELRSAQRSAVAVVAGWTWEDETHLLATVYADGEWSVVRLGADGSAELALAPRPGGEDYTRGIVVEQR